MTAPVASKTPPPDANPPSNPPPDRRPPDNRPPRTPPADRRPPSSLAEALDVCDLTLRALQILDARELVACDPALRMRLTYALDLGRRAVADLQSPARRDLVDSGADPTAIARSGGPAPITRAGRPPAPGAGRICAHCGGPMRGYASAGDAWLCHPDSGIDCYHLVTLYGHPAPCAACMTRGGQGDFMPSPAGSPKMPRLVGPPRFDLP